MFWHSAQTEITKNFKEKADVLKIVKIDLTDSIRAMLGQELQDEKKAFNHRIVSIVDRQKVLTNEKIRRALIAATHQRITQLKEKWQVTHKKGSTQGIKLLSTLETLKIASERNEGLIKMFAKPSLTLSAHELLRIIFEIVRKGMYREDWGELVAAEVVGIDEGKGTTTV